MLGVCTAQGLASRKRLAVAPSRGGGRLQPADHLPPVDSEHPVPYSPVAPLRPDEQPVLEFLFEDADKIAVRLRIPRLLVIQMLGHRRGSGGCGDARAVYPAVGVRAPPGGASPDAGAAA